MQISIPAIGTYDIDATIEHCIILLLENQQYDVCIFNRDNMDGDPDEYDDTSNAIQWILFNLSGCVHYLNIGLRADNNKPYFCITVMNKTTKQPDIHLRPNELNSYE